jgi:hypothetical protein
MQSHRLRFRKRPTLRRNGYKHESVQNLDMLVGSVVGV